MEVDEEPDDDDDDDDSDSDFESDDAGASDAEDLVPFSPPADYAFEPELCGSPPRPIPPELRDGRYAHERRLKSWFLLVFGMESMGVSLLPVMGLWTQIVPPLRLVFWLGAVAATSAVLIQWRGNRGRYDYVRKGIPTIAHIRSCVLSQQTSESSGSGAPFVYTVYFNYIHPDPVGLGGSAGASHSAAADSDEDDSEKEDSDERDSDKRDSDEVRRAAEHSGDEASDAGDADLPLGLMAGTHESDTIPAGFKDLVGLSYREGDYATAVYLPGRVEKSIRLYGLLGLRPDLGVVDLVRVRRPSLAWVIFAFTSMFAFILAMAWNVYAWYRYWPIAPSMEAFRFPLFLGGAVFGCLQLARWFFGRVQASLRPSTDEEVDETVLDHVTGPPKPGEAIVLRIVAMLMTVALGSVTMLCWFVTANAWLDESPPVDRAVTVESFQRDDVHVGFVPVLRGCVLRGKLGQDQQKFAVLYPPDRWTAWSSNEGVAEVREGWLGWPWVSDVRPAGK